MAAILRAFGLHDCGVAHFHVDDPTCRAGGSGSEPGAQNGPHRHAGSKTCFGEDEAPIPKDAPGVCVRPHHHVNDPSWRPA